MVVVAIILQRQIMDNCSHQPARAGVTHAVLRGSASILFHARLISVLLQVIRLLEAGGFGSPRVKTIRERKGVFDSCSGEEGGGTQLDKYKYNDKEGGGTQVSG